MDTILSIITVILMNQLILDLLNKMNIYKKNSLLFSEVQSLVI